MLTLYKRHRRVKCLGDEGVNLVTAIIEPEIHPENSGKIETEQHYLFIYSTIQIPLNTQKKSVKILIIYKQYEHYV